MVLLPDASDPTWTRARIVVWWILVPALLLTFGYYEAGQFGWFQAGSQAAEPRPDSADVRPTAAERDGAARRFRDVADSLDGALQRYSVRRSDFESDRVGCESLATGYREVDRQFVSLSVMLKQDGARLGTELRSRYREFSDEVDEVNRHFDNTDCRVAR